MAGLEGDSDDRGSGGNVNPFPILSAFVLAERRLVFSKLSGWIAMTIITYFLVKAGHDPYSVVDIIAFTIIVSIDLSDLRRSWVKFKIRIVEDVMAS